MACTGGPDQEPMKVGVALSDVMTGMNAAIGVLAALHSREQTGQGQHVDLSLIDCTLASLTNIAQYYLTSGECPPRLGNAHPTIVPYQTFKAQDGYVVIAVGNDRQFTRLCEFMSKSEWATDERFAKNKARVQNRETLVPMIEKIVAAKPAQHWLDGLRDVDVPCGPVNTMDKVFEMEQVQTREMGIAMEHGLSPDPVKIGRQPV